MFTFQYVLLPVLAGDAGGKLLKIVEMEYKYGTKDDKGNPNKTLTLAIEAKE